MGGVPGAACALVASLLTASPGAAAAAGTPLFLLARSKNANVVEYLAKVGADGRLTAEGPIDVRWRLKAEDGRPETLSFFERLFAYGVSARLDPDRDGCEVEIVSLRSRPFHVRRSASGWEADAEIGGAPARLTRIFVTSEETRVRAVELWGVRLADGKPVYERLVP